MDMVTNDGSMERYKETLSANDKAELMVKRHQSASHPEIQCQCLECLYAREIIAQCEVLGKILP